MIQAALLLFFASLFPVAGCAPSVPHAPERAPHPGLHATRFASPKLERADRAGGWIGRYEGTGSMYTDSVGGWRQEERLELIVRSGDPGFLTVEGLSLSRAGWGFSFEVEMEDSGVLAGKRLSPDGSARYEYSFARDGDRISGVLKRYRVEASGAPHPSPDEWVFEVYRK